MEGERMGDGKKRGDIQKKDWEVGRRRSKKEVR